MEIRSYRAVFAIERRIYRIDRLRLNPAGVPVRGIVYFLALLATIVLCTSVPPLRILKGALPWYLLYLALPVASAGLLTVIVIDGRPAHLAVQALLRHRLAPRVFIGSRARRDAGGTPGGGWRPAEILLLPDGSEARLCRLRYTGPGAVLVSVAHERIAPPAAFGMGRSRLTVRELAGRPRPRHGQVIVLAAGVRLRTVSR